MGTVREVLGKRWCSFIVKLILGYFIFKFGFFVYYTISLEHAGLDSTRISNINSARMVKARTYDTTRVFTPIANNSAGLSQPLPRDKENVETLKKENEDKVNVHENISGILSNNIKNTNTSLFMTNCPPNSVLEVTNKEPNSAGLPSQVCRIIGDNNGSWTCQEGWERLLSKPYCKKPNQTKKKAAKPQWSQVSDDRKMLFIHIPKTGGTSIETSFLFDEQKKKLNGHYLGGHHKIIAFDQDVFKDYHKFCMVRHPCSKLLSVWSYYTQGLGNGGDNKWVNKFMTNETISSFNVFVTKTLKPQGQVEATKQLHLQIQVGMVFDKEDNFALDQLLVFEKWNESMDALGRSLKEDMGRLKLAHRLSSHHKTCQDIYTPETWRKMTEIYALDFCTLGYSTDMEETGVSPPIDLTPDVLTSRYRNCIAK